MDDRSDLPGRGVRLHEHGRAAEWRRLAALVARAAPLAAREGETAAWPPGLMPLLTGLRRDLWIHQTREQALIFPLMRTAGRAQIQHAVCRMIEDHEQLRARISQTAQAVAEIRPAGGDADAWRAWAQAYGRFERRLHDRLGQEEQELFLKFFDRNATKLFLLKVRNRAAAKLNIVGCNWHPRVGDRQCAR